MDKETFFAMGGPSQIVEPCGDCPVNCARRLREKREPSVEEQIAEFMANKGWPKAS